MVLPDDVAKLLRPQAVGQRMRRLVLEKRAHPALDMGLVRRRCIPSRRSPAKAGAHFPAWETVDGWIPTNAGKRDMQTLIVRSGTARQRPPNTPSNVVRSAVSTSAIVAFTPNAASEVTPYSLIPHGTMPA